MAIFMTSLKTEYKESSGHCGQGKAKLKYHLSREEEITPVLIYWTLGINTWAKSGGIFPMNDLLVY